MQVNAQKQDDNRHSHTSGEHLIRRKEHSQEIASRDTKARQFSEQLRRRRRIDSDEDDFDSGNFELLQPPQLLNDSRLPPYMAVTGTAFTAEALSPPIGGTTSATGTGDSDNHRLDYIAQAETISRVAMQLSAAFAMSNQTSEYLVRLNSSLLSRSRLRVRASEGSRVEVVCESSDAGEREWFDRNSAPLQTRMSEVTGKEIVFRVEST